MERSEESTNQDENCWEDESNDTVPPDPHILRQQKVHVQEFLSHTHISVRKFADAVAVVFDVCVGSCGVDPHGDCRKQSKQPAEQQRPADY